MDLGLFEPDALHAAIRLVEHGIAAEREAILGARWHEVHGQTKERGPGAEIEGVGEWIRLHDTDPIIRGALLIGVYSHLEYELNRWCGELKEAHGLARSPRDLRDRGIVRARKYLEKEIGLPFDFDGCPEWATLRTYGDLRNVLAHNGGIVEKPEDVVAFPTLPKVRLRNAAEWNDPEVLFVSLDVGACEALVDTATTFLVALRASSEGAR